MNFIAIWSWIDFENPESEQMKVESNPNLEFVRENHECFSDETSKSKKYFDEILNVFKVADVAIFWFELRLSRKAN